MPEQPSFTTIANLFSVQPAEESTEAVQDNRKVGRNADESDALGRASINDGNYEAAIKHFRRAVEQRDPSDISSRLDLAGALAYAEQAPQALRQYELALRANATSAEARRGLADTYRQYGRFSDAIQQLVEAINVDPTNPFNHIKLAETYHEAGFPKRALEAAQSAILAKPDESYYHFWMGDLLVQLKRFDEALDSFQAAIELSPGDDYLYERASIAFWGAGRHTEAIKAVRLASDLDPEKSIYHGLLYEYLFEAGLKDEAELERESADRMDSYDKERLFRILVECGIEEE